MKTLAFSWDYYLYIFKLPLRLASLDTSPDKWRQGCNPFLHGLCLFWKSQKNRGEIRDSFLHFLCYDALEQYRYRPKPCNTHYRENNA